MIITIESLLDADQLKIIQNNLAAADFIDGLTTAGWHARLVKQNQQLDRTNALAKNLQKMVSAALHNNALFEAAAYPQQIHSLLFSRYKSGMEYGRHVDNALMGKGDRRHRADLSFTLFLSDPDHYSGGALVIEGACDEQPYRLPAGSLLLYPSSTLHRVDPVAQGCRFACVGWVQSWIRDPAKRELLFDLDTARRSLFAREGKSIEFDLLSKTYANLLRRWSE